MPQRSKPSDSWAALMREQLLSNSTLPVGKGWKTKDQLRKEFGLGLGLLDKTIKALIEQGKLEKFVGSEPKKVGGKSYHQAWYRPTRLLGMA